MTFFSLWSNIPNFSGKNSFPEVLCDSDTDAKSLKEGYWVWGPSTTDLIKEGVGFLPLFCWKVICWLLLTEKLAFLSVPKYLKVPFRWRRFFPVLSKAPGLYLGSIQTKFTFLWSEITHKAELQTEASLTHLLPWVPYEQWDFKALQHLGSSFTVSGLFCLIHFFIHLFHCAFI